MSQSTTTVTPPSPTPPTNMSFTGRAQPNPPNYSKTQYANPFNLTANASGANGSTIVTDGRPQSPYGVNPNPPPFFDDGSAGALSTLATNTAALSGGSAATAGGTEGTYPGTGTSTSVNFGGAVPASSTQAHEGSGSEVLITAPGSRAECPTQAVVLYTNYVASGVNASFNSVDNPPNGKHASSLSPAGAATITTFSPATTASGAGTFALTVNGTNFTSQSVVYVNDIAQVTVFVNLTQLTVAAAPKKATAGTLPVRVRTAGVVETAATNYTFT